MKRHILLVDDDIDEMKTFVEALKDAEDRNDINGSFKCTYASNGVHALKMLYYLEPDAIFIDYDMPSMNGLQLTEAIKKEKKLQSVPVFLYSKQFKANIKEKAEELGIAGCLERPASPELLSLELKRCLRSQHN